MSDLESLTREIQFFQNTLDALQKYVHQCLETIPCYMMITFAIWPLKALIYLEYQIQGTTHCDISVKLYNHCCLLKEVEIFKHSFHELHYCVCNLMAQGVKLPLGTLPTFQTSNLSENEKAEATTVIHYLLGHAHHIAMENGCTFQGDIVRIHGSEILVHFKVNFLPTEEFPETEEYRKTVRLNLRGDYHSQLIYHVIDAIIYVTPIVPGHRYIKHTCCSFMSNVWAHNYHLHHPEQPTHHDHFREDVPH